MDPGWDMWPLQGLPPAPLVVREWLEMGAPGYGPQNSFHRRHLEIYMMSPEYPPASLRNLYDVPGIPPGIRMPPLSQAPAGRQNELRNHRVQYHGRPIWD